MKKNLYLMAFAAIVSCFTSCSKDDDNDTSAPKETTLSTPQYKDDAVHLTLPANRLTVGGRESSVSVIELAESGTYLVAYQRNSTRAEEGTDYLTGNFTKDGESYNLKGFATVTIKGKSGTTYNIVVKTTDGTTAELSATASSGKVASGVMTDNLCRTWKIEKTLLTVTADGLTAGKEFIGTCDLNKMIDYAKDKGVEINDKVDYNSIVTAITFSRAGTFVISYQNGKNDVGKWNWSNQSSGALRYSWDSADMGNSLENGQATVGFEDGKCKLTLGATVDNHQIQAAYTLGF